MDMRILEIGSGRNFYKARGNEEVIHLDIAKLPHVEKVHDLNRYPWPFKNNEFDEVLCFMTLEHLENWPKAMEEIWRISKKGAIIKIKVPFFPSMYSVIDPTHKSFFTYYTFDYFEPGHSLDYYSKAKFKVLKKHIRFSWNKILNIMSIPINMFPKVYCRYLSFMLPSNELYFELKTVK